jgi:phosphoglycolate phosphatase
MASDELAAALAACTAVLFDFDGPVCDVFAGLPAPAVADELAGILATHDGVLAAKASAMEDPMEVLRLSQRGSSEALAAVEDALTAAELSAVAVAGPPVAGAAEALRIAHDSGRGVAVVSNNSAECVRAFLDRHGLAYLVSDVIGRPGRHPELMKPAPYSVAKAVTALATPAGRCLLVGDSVTDIQAARAAGTMAVGYANKPGKAAALSTAGADAVVSGMQALADGLGVEG